MRIAPFLLAALLFAAQPCVAKPQKAYAGADTTAGTTNDSSGPKSHSSGPNKPDASFCKDYKGAVHRQCLETVMRGTPKQKGARK